MKRRHKNKVMIGLVIWSVTLPLAISTGIMWVKLVHHHGRYSACLTMAVLFVVSMLVQYAVFFWGGSHLAAAKGHSSAILAVGIFWPAQVIILALLLFALPDKYARRPSPSQKKKPGEAEPGIAREVRSPGPNNAP